jgi:hypothetical protein
MLGILYLRLDICVRLLDRQPHSKRSANAHSGLDLNRTSVRAHYGVRNRETLARPDPNGLGREEWIEQPGTHFVCDATPIVRHFEYRGIIAAGRSHANGAGTRGGTCRDSICGIHEQVDHDLHQFAGMPEYGWQLRSKIQFEGTDVRPRVSRDLDGVADNPVDVHPGLAGMSRVRVISKTLHDSLDLCQPLGDALQGGRHALVEELKIPNLRLKEVGSRSVHHLERLREELHVVSHVLQGRTDLVCDPRHEYAHGLELLCQDLLRFLLRRTVASIRTMTISAWSRTCRVPTATSSGNSVPSLRNPWISFAEHSAANGFFASPPATISEHGRPQS